MISEKIWSFRTVPELQQFLENHINTMKIQSDKLSKVIGEKLRTTDSSNNAELLELKGKIEGGTTDSKKKKNTTKKDQKNNWYRLEAVSIYDGIGLKGELELYFRALEEAKSELEKLTKVKQAIDDLVNNKGLKKDLGCVFVMNQGLPAEMAFTGLAEQRKKFIYKAILNLPIEQFDEVKI